MKNRKIKLENGKSVIVTAEDITEILADDSTISYWASEVHLNKIAYARTKKAMQADGTYDGATIEDIMTRAVFENYGLEITTEEDVDGQDRFVIGLEEILFGIKMFLDNDAEIEVTKFSDYIEEGAYDGATVDAILQYACFDEIVFG